MTETALSPIENVNQPVVKHFWVSTFPYFETALLLVPPQASAVGTIAAEIDLFDADGLRVNKVALEVPADQVFVMELEPLLGSCKLEQGMKHAHMVVSSHAGAYCRMHGREGGALLGEPARVSATRASFFPLTFQSERSNLLCIINCGDQEVSLRGRLFVGRRSPEVGWTIPARASRVFHLETDFHEFIELGEQGQACGYLRLSTKSGSLGVQLVERTPGSREHGIYNALS